MELIFLSIAFSFSNMTSNDFILFCFNVSFMPFPLVLGRTCAISGACDWKKTTISQALTKVWNLSIPSRVYSISNYDGLVWLTHHFCLFVPYSTQILLCMYATEKKEMKWQTYVFSQKEEVSGLVINLCQHLSQSLGDLFNASYVSV